MIKYFYYIWNLLTNTERYKLVEHFGQCLMAALLYTITDWNYLILLWSLSYEGINILYTVIGVQLFSLIIGFWYYFIKYKIMTSQNYFYKILSTRHYNYILNRISKNAPYMWINEKSNVDLAKQLDSTEKGLQSVFNFITQIVRLISIIGMSIFVISWNYKACFLIFGLFSLVGYYLSTQNFNFSSKQREKFQRTNDQNSLIISDNLSLLFDNVIHNDYGKIISNIVTFNNQTKNEQVKMYSNENRIYIKIGLTLMTLYVLTLIFVTFWMNMGFKEFNLFFIASLLSYKCINSNINELLDMYSDVRQTIIDFDSLSDLWTNTLTKRPEYQQIELPSYQLNYEEVEKYMNHRFDEIGVLEIKVYNDFFTKYKIQNKFRQYALQINLDIDNDPREKLLHYMKKFVSSTLILTETFKKYNMSLDSNSRLKPNDEIYFYKKYKQTNLYKKPYKSKFKISIHELYFCYPYTESENLYSIKYKNNKNPIKIYSNSHLLVTGPSGSGKSTFLKIIRGIIPLLNEKYDSIKMDLDIYGQAFYEEISWQNILSHISYSQQNNCAFNGGSIYQILSDDFITKKQNKEINKCELMKKALKVACVDYKFYDLDYICTKETVSGGQRQRLVLAKNIYRIFCDDKQIIILDEVDAGIDLETAKKIMINLLILFKNRTLIVVLHTKELMDLFTSRINISNGIINFV